MKSISSANQAALAARRLLPRDFLTITARNRDTGQPETVGFWSDLSHVDALVVDPDTGQPVMRSFYGAGALISISDIPAVAGITVQRVTIRMSQLDELVEQAIRLYDIKQARVEIHTGLLNPDSHKLVDPAEPLFVGFVDEAEIKTPRENEDGAAILSCTSHTQELARTNPETRSHEDQGGTNGRWPSDDFFVDAAVCGDWDHFWAGRQEQTQKRRGIFGWGGFLGIF